MSSPRSAPVPASSQDLPSGSAPSALSGSATVVRPAVTADAAAVLAIRAEEIRTGTALWTDTVPEPAAAEAWFEALRDAGRILVATGGEEVLGFACFAPLRPYDGYRFTAEDSVYLVPAARGQGLGTLLLTALVERARAAGMHSLVANVEAGNAASVRLHERCGFTRAGLLPETGCKGGRWLDLLILQRML